MTAAKKKTVTARSSAKTKTRATRVKAAKNTKTSLSKAAQTAKVTAKPIKTSKPSRSKTAKVTAAPSTPEVPVIPAPEPVPRPMATAQSPDVSATVSLRQRAHMLLSNKWFDRGYMVFGLLTLLATTLVWSLLSARLQGSNADQIVDPYLFTSGATFHGADFPGAHSFLVKWPLFWLTRVLGVSSASLIFITVLAVILTVGVLVGILYHLERRPVVFGTLCLALASCLLLVPATPAPGTLLPVNMAMLTTRNLEYALYLGGLVLLVSTKKTRNWRFWAAVAVLGLLAASDKLFLDIGLGGAAIALLVYGLRRNWKLVEASSRWLLAGVGAALVAYSLLALLESHGITHIINSTGTSPYQVTHGAKNLVLGSIFAVTGFLTNLGANPAYSTVEVAKLPHQALSGLLGYAGAGYITNLIIVLVGLAAVWKLARPSLFGRPSQAPSFGRAHVLSLQLVWSSLAAVGFFIASNHYYPVDARYLTICLFTLFIAIATVSRGRAIRRPSYLVLSGLVMTIGMGLAIPHVVEAYHAGQQAVASTNNRNHLIVQALGQHHVDVLVGDYWRVIPTKLASQGALKVMPLDDCTTPNATLTSQAWQPDLRKHSFAYLLTYDGSLTSYPNCTLSQVVKAYGRPNASILIAGNFANPREVLLFYDHGRHQYVPPSTKVPLQPVASVIPIGLDELPGTTCDGPTIMQVVAHEDDDLLFMNPDLLHDIQAGHCVRTVYVTAGDAGAGQFYWLSRQQGSEDAYATMLHTSDTWTQRIIKLSNTSYVTIASPMGNPKISLLFLNLPDGGLYGEGFPASHNQSLAKLESGQISKVQTVDQESSYTTTELASTLETLMHTYQPAEIRTQAPNNESPLFPDHSDHLAVGKITRRAHDQYQTDQYEDKVAIPISYYIGYPIHAREANVSGTDLDFKVAAFLAYAKHDGSVCHTASSCANDGSVYGAYLVRQYQE